MRPQKVLLPWLFSLCISGLAWSQTTTPRSVVRIRTTAGTLVVALYNSTPVHRDRFLENVREHRYDSTLMHRVVRGFMVQGGDPASRRADDRSKLLGAMDTVGTLPAEIDPRLVHKRGALAAVRRDDGVNPERRSDPYQYYIVLGGRWEAADLERITARRSQDPANPAFQYTPEQVQAYANLGGAPHLDGAYTVFGEVIEGFEVLDLLERMECDGSDRPSADVRTWMTVIE